MNIKWASKVGTTQHWSRRKHTFSSADITNFCFNRSVNGADTAAKLFINLYHPAEPKKLLSDFNVFGIGKFAIAEILWDRCGFHLLL